MPLFQINSFSISSLLALIFAVEGRQTCKTLGTPPLHDDLPYRKNASARIEDEVTVVEEAEHKASGTVLAYTTVRFGWRREAWQLTQ